MQYIPSKTYAFYDTISYVSQFVILDWYVNMHNKIVERQAQREPDRLKKPTDC